MKFKTIVLFLFYLFIFCTINTGKSQAGGPDSGALEKIDLNKVVRLTLANSFTLKESVELLLQKEADYYVVKDDMRTTKVGGYYKGGTLSDLRAYDEIDTKAEFTYKMPMGDRIIARAEVIKTNFTNQAGNDIYFEYRYPLAKGGGLIIGWQEVRRAQRNWTIEELRYFISKQTIVNNVVKSYFLLLQANKIIEVNQAAVENAKINLKITKRKFEEGLVPKIDLSRAQILLVQAEDGLLSAIKTWEDRRDELAIKMGIDPRRSMEYDYAINYIPKDFGTDESVNLAMVLRKELLVTGEELVQKGEDVLIAANNLKPQVDLVAQYGTVRREFLYTGIENITYPTWSTMVQCSIDVSRRALKEDLLKARRLKVLYEEKMEDVKRQIVAQVREGVRLIKLAINRVELREQNLKAADERLHLATRSWEEGLIQNREVVDAQQDRVNAQVELVKAKIDYITAEYDLRLAIGYDLAHIILWEKHDKRIERKEP